MIRSQAPFIFEGSMDEFNLASDDVGLGGVRDPTGGGENDVTIEDQLQEKHEFFGAWSDEDMIGVNIDVVFFSVELGDGFAEGFEAGDREVVFFVGVHFEGFNDGDRYGKRRLSEAQAIDGAAFSLHKAALFINGESRRRADAADI